MTRGLRAHAFARRVFREDTFTLMVSPAIADLQFEAAAGGIAALVRGYVALAKAFYGGLLHDIHADLRVLYADATDLLRVVAMQACYYAAMLSVIGGAGLSKFSDGEFIVLAVGIVGVSVIPALVCFWPDRYAPATNPSE